MSYPFNPQEMICEQKKDGRFCIIPKIGLSPTNADYFSAMTTDEAKKASRPMDTFEEWSRIWFEIHSGDKSVYAKMDIRDFRCLCETVKVLLVPRAEKAVVGKPFIRFSKGRFAGMTPAQALESAADAEEDIIANAKFLLDNHSGKPERLEFAKQMIDAVLKTHEGERTEVGKTAEIDLIPPADFRSTTERKGDKVKFYGLKITYSESRRYPVCVTAWNYFAKKMIASSGEERPEMSTKEDECKLSYYFTVTDFYGMIDEVNMMIQSLVNRVAPNNWAVAKTLKEQRDKERQSPSPEEVDYL